VSYQTRSGPTVTVWVKRARRTPAAIRPPDRNKSSIYLKIYDDTAAGKVIRERPMPEIFTANPYFSHCQLGMKYPKANREDWIEAWIEDWNRAIEWLGKVLPQPTTKRFMAPLRAREYWKNTCVRTVPQRSGLGFGSTTTTI